MKPLFVIGTLMLTKLALGRPIQWPENTYHLDISKPLQTILDDAKNKTTYTYPTDLTRGIVPKPIHSHNDYWRDVPFFSALSMGCESVEADVWLYNDTLYVGHETQALTSERTFDSLYVQPILSVLNRQNPQGGIVPSNDKNGVFDAAPDQTLYLFVDVKTTGSTTWPFVVRALEPLRRAGYLTTANRTIVTKGAVTVIGTGRTPLDQVQGLSTRDYFYDADAALLNTTQSDINSTVSPIASADFSAVIGPVNNKTLNETQLATVRGHIAVAKSRGMDIRYYETPAYPISTRNAIWDVLTAEGVGLLNADDLPAAAGFGSPAPW